MQPRIFSILLVFLSVNATATSYLCTSKVNTGILNDIKTGDFVTGDMLPMQILFRPSKENPEFEYGVFDSKTGNFLFGCEYWFPEVEVAHCSSQGGYYFKFIGSENGYKFSFADMGMEYLMGVGLAAPRIAVGSCLKL
jgi:hypothetical protein